MKKIYISTASPQFSSTQDGTGDIDYAKTLIESFKNSGQDAEFLLENSEEKIYSSILSESTRKGSSPILHILINSPGLGTAFSRKGIEDFKKKGGRVVITVVEFVRGNMTDQHRRLALQNIDLAEKIIFLDDNDKNEAIKFNNSPDKDRILQESSVIPVPATVNVTSDKSLDEKGRDIMSFGMIRTGKGFSSVISLAKLIKASGNEKCKHKKILIAGTVQTHNIGGIDALVNEILKPLYPEHHKQIDKILKQNPDLGTEENRKKVIEELKKLYNNTLKYIDTLPVELHFDVPTSELGNLFDRCCYSYLPAYRGATLRNTSISTSITQKLITYSGEGKITPNILKQGQEYHGAVILESDPQKVFDDIEKRENNPQLNDNTRIIQTKLVNQEISKEVIARKHIAIYDEIKFPEKTNDSDATKKLSSVETIENTLQKLTEIDVADLEKHEKLFVYHLFLESREEIRKSTKSDEEKTKHLTEYFNNKIDTFYGYLDDEKLKKLKINEQILKDNFTTINDGLNLSKDNPYEGKDQWYRIYGHDDVFVSKLWKIDNRLDLEMRLALNIKKENENSTLEFYDRTNPFKPGFPFGTIVASTPGLIMTALRMGVNSTKFVTKNIVKILDCKKIDNSNLTKERQ